MGKRKRVDTTPGAFVTAPRGRSFEEFAPGTTLPPEHQDPAPTPELFNRYCGEPCPNCGMPTVAHRGKLEAIPAVKRTGCQLTIGTLVCWFIDEEATREEV